MKKKILIIFITLCLIGGGIYYFFGTSRAEQSDANLLNVQTQKLTPESITTKANADGNIKTKNEKNIKIKIGGLVEEVFVEEGKLLAHGDKVVKLDDERLKNSLQTAQLNLRESKNNYEDLKLTYETQKELNSLKITEAEKNLQIAILSRDKEELNLTNRRIEIEEQVAEIKNELERLKKDLTDKQFLYQKGAIPEVELNMIKENYEKTQIQYNNLQIKLDNLINKTIPNTMQLAELQVENARNNLELLKTNLKKEQVNKNDLEAAQIKVIKIEQEIDNIKNDLDKLLVKAPINGTVVNMEINPGDKINEGMTIAKIADIDNLIAEIMVDEIDINDINQGQTVYITSDSFEEKLEGKIIYTAPVSTKVGNINKYKTKVEITDNRGVLKPGMFVNAEIITNHKENVLTVPSIAVLGNDEKYVFVEEEGKAVKKEVEIGLKSLSKVEIKGLTADTKVITGPFTTLKNLTAGTPVQDLTKTTVKESSK